MKPERGELRLIRQGLVGPMRWYWDVCLIPGRIEDGVIYPSGHACGWARTKRRARRAATAAFAEGGIRG